MNNAHHNRVAIVTGGGQGIGKCITRRLLEHDIRVVIAEIDDEAGKQTASEFSAFGMLEYISCDVSKEEDVKRTVNRTVERMGQLDILVNNAGIGINKPISELSLDEWNRVIGVNLTGTFLCSKYAAPYLKKRRGAIINIASTRAFMSEPNTEAYSATKGGIYSLTHSLGISLAPDIRVNCISPGWIATDAWQKKSRRHEPDLRPIDHEQHPAGRVGTPDDIAALVLFLIDTGNSFITGANFTVDGGMTRKMIYEE